MNPTKIEWCDMTWNPVTGCRHGCPYCYARQTARRFGGCWNGKENAVAPPTMGDTVDKFDHLVFKTKKGKLVRAPYPFGFEPTFRRDRLEEPAHKTRPRRIFVGSMTDLFGEWVPDEWIKEVFDACAKATQHSYMFLTKNPDRYMDIMHTLARTPLPRFYFGMSVTDEAAARGAEEVISYCYADLMLFLSIEPLHADVAGLLDFEGLHWVIIGAETGNRKERVVPERRWVENIVDACRAAEVPVFMKDSLAEIWGEPLLREYPEGLR